MNKGSGIILAVFISTFISFFVFFVANYSQNIFNYNQSLFKMDEEVIKDKKINNISYFNDIKDSFLTSKVEGNKINNYMVFDSNNAPNLFKIFIFNMSKIINFKLIYKEKFINELFYNSEFNLDLRGETQSELCHQENAENKEKICWFPSTVDTYNFNIDTIFFPNNAANKIFYLSMDNLIINEIPHNYKIYVIKALESCLNFDLVRRENYIEICLDQNNVNDLELYTILENDLKKDVIIE